MQLAGGRFADPCTPIADIRGVAGFIDTSFNILQGSENPSAAFLPSNSPAPAVSPRFPLHFHVSFSSVCHARLLAGRLDFPDACVNGTVRFMHEFMIVAP